MKTDYTRNSILGCAGRFPMWAIILLAGVLPVSAAPPQGLVFRQVSAGYGHTVAVKTDGTL